MAGLLIIIDAIAILATITGAVQLLYLVIIEYLDRKFKEGSRED